MYQRSLILIGLLLAGAALGAQPDTVPLSVPPKGLLTTPVDPAQAPRPPIGTPAKPASAAPAGAQAQAQEPATTPTKAEPSPTQVLRELVATTRNEIAPGMQVKPPPPDITVRNGITEIIPIAQGRMNRFITPFHDPVIKMDDRPDADVSRAGNILYVLTNSSSPVSMFVMERSDPVHAMSLTLQPAAIPPVQVNLHMEGWTPPPPQVPYAAQDQEQTDEPYLNELVSTMRALAMHKVPDGYALLQDKPKDLPAAACRIPGASVKPAQWMLGHAIGAVIARVQNQTVDGVDLHEADCAGEGVLAVAAWPRTHLEPGEQTELYLLVRRRAPQASGEQRPSVLTSGG